MRLLIMLVVFALNHNYGIPTITTDEVVVSYPSKRQLSHIQHLAQIASGESIPGSYDDALSVINVVLNRVESDRYPNTIYGVISQKKGRHKQFDGYGSKRYWKPKEVHYRAAKAVVLKNERVLPNDCYHFANVPASTDKKWLRTLKNRFKKVQTNYHPQVKRWQHTYFTKK